MAGQRCQYVKNCRNPVTHLAQRWTGEELAICSTCSRAAKQDESIRYVARLRK